MKTIRLSFFLIFNASVLLAQQPSSETIKDSLTTISLEEVLLTGIRAKDDIPVTFTNVSRQDLAPRNLGQDIPILLNYLPGVVTTSDAGAGIGYTGIRVRGSDATRVNVTINGIPYNDSESQGTFWVNLLGKGYPAPTQSFRWCTERLKIKPSNAFIRRVVRRHGEAILVLGIRKAESAARAKVMEKHEGKRIRDRLSPNASLPNSLIYSPVEDWSNDDVWLFLMQKANPWGYENQDLLTMYQGASADGECPLVVDTSTPSCGDSRFGCWTCTLVEKDKSM